ncbi:gas vesicle protein [Isoptericola sp. NPDC057191]|uniref:gas vesicle protein GvpO n=1 Tax=Isoptericola sp. NPDC057191 TaxID=3346041 RepID=UPI00362D6356
MSPARKAHAAPARRSRPSATHEQTADDVEEQEQVSDEDAPTDEAPEEEAPEEEAPEDEAPEDDEPQDDEAPEDEPQDDEAPEDDEPQDDEAPEDDPPEEDDPADEDEAPEDDEPQDDPPSRGRLDAQGAARLAVRQLKELSHHDPEGVVGIERDADGWIVTVEVLEDAHVPSTSDVLAEYEVRLDPDGGLLGVTRGRRYVRGRTER